MSRGSTRFPARMHLPAPRSLQGMAVAAGLDTIEMLCSLGKQRSN